MQSEQAIAYMLDRLQRELSPSLTYHNVQHTIDVAAQTERIAHAEGITNSEELTLLKLAAYYHDAGFLNVYDDHEAVGCRIVTETLPGFGFSDRQIEQICQLIQATRLPQTPTSHLAMILCDADLDYLGRNDFPDISPTLFDEWKAFGRLTDPDAWMTIQVRFLANHRYFTTTNQQLREPVKQQHLTELRRIMGV